ncbi:MAG: CDP-alcohol phosphatidyltransferase family protein [Alphaproteobacteria bacterium]
MSHNTWIHRLVRPSARALARTPVTPNQVTAVRLIAGLAAAAAYAVGEPLDRADGELARVTGIMTEWGHRFDLVSDAVVNAALFIGIGIGLRASELGPWSIPLGLLAGFSVAMILGLVIQMEAREGKSKPAFAGAGGFDPDDAILAVPIAMWLGWAEPLLIAAAIGAPAFTIFAYLRFRLRGKCD